MSLDPRFIKNRRTCFLLSEPVTVHGFHEFLGNGIAGTFTNDGINTAVRADRRTATIAGIIINQPILNFGRVKDPAAVKAPADPVFFEHFHVIVTEIVGFDIIFHKTFPKVTSPKSNESTNSTTSAYLIGVRLLARWNLNSMRLPVGVPRYLPCRQAASSAIDPCHSLAFLPLPPAAVGSLPNSSACGTRRNLRLTEQARFLPTTAHAYALLYLPPAAQSNAATSAY